jgi:hypothetical protein
MAGPGSGGTNAGIHGLFLDFLNGQATVVYDLRGGLHVAGGGPSGLRYGFCASQCDQASNWAYADVAGALTSVAADSGGYALAVDGQGHPRVMTTWHLNGTNYFECNDQCTKSSSWTTATKIRSFIPNPGAHFFAVSPQGTPAFAVLGKGGVAYESCASSCTTAANWTETLAAPVPAAFLMSTVDGVLDASLTFDPQGGVRMTYVLASGNNDRVGYAACDTSCNSPTAWQSLTPQAGAISSPLLGLDASGNPRVVDSTKGAYYWCDSECATNGQNWQGPVTSGQADWLAVDGLGDIHTVHAADPAVNYTWCASNCTSMSPQWQTLMLPFADMDAADPTAMGSHWKAVGSLGSSISIDSGGAAAITLNAARWPAIPPLSGADNPEASGVFLWLVPAATGNPASNSGSSSGGSSSSSSSSGSAGSSGSGSGGGSGDSGTDPLANFVGAPWSGTETTTVACGGAGAQSTSKAVSWSFRPTASGFTFSDANGCSWSLTVSGSSAMLASAPETCKINSDAGAESLSISTATLTTPDGHHMMGHFKGTATLGTTACSVDASITLKR